MKCWLCGQLVTMRGDRAQVIGVHFATPLDRTPCPVNTTPRTVTLDVKSYFKERARSGSK